ncbi:MAG: triose-phosphate isomerase [Candidatus Wallbacteria bacterium]
MRKRMPIFAANWKMYKTFAETAKFIDELKANFKSFDPKKVEAVICPPFTSLFKASEKLFGTKFELGAQNMNFEKEGAFTGEIAPAMLLEFGVKYVIIGHSERRAYYNETDETVNKKLKFAIANGLIPILCVGETLQEREAGHTQQKVANQIKADFAGISEADAEKIVIAYEPIWAIGTGKNATKDDAVSVINTIRQEMAKTYSKPLSEKIRIQYGGSVKPENIKEYMADETIDGALIGGAALDPAKFIKICESVL